MHQLETILNNLMGGVILCNYSAATQSSRVIYINRGWADITGYSMEDLEREKDGNPQALVLAEDREVVSAQYERQLRQGRTYELMYRIVHRSGSLRWVIDKGMVTPLPNGQMQNQSVLTDVTAIKEQEERMRLLAQTDLLTNLNNKITFARLAQNVLSRQSERCHALLLLDIDNFKGINDTFGHPVGDQVLQAIANQLQTLFRSRDVLGRVGGDEFMILMTDVPNATLAGEKARTLNQAVNDIELPGIDHPPLTISIGIAMFTGKRSYEELFNQADTALYQAKAKGKNQFVLMEAT